MDNLKLEKILSKVENFPSVPAAVIDRLGIELSQNEIISEKVTEWVDELTDALTFN